MPKVNVSGIEEYMDRRLGGHTGKHPEMQWHCPFCVDRRGSESRKRTLRVNIEKGVGMCFRCEARFGSLHSLLKSMNGGKLTKEEKDLLEGVRSHERTETLGLWSDVLLTLFDRDEDGGTRELLPVPMPEECLPLAALNNRIHAHVFAYLEKRNIPLERAIHHRVGYCPIGRYERRLIFPVFQGGRCVYFTNRYVGEHLMKSLNPKNAAGYYTKDHCILGFDDLVGQPVVLLVEGPFDRLAQSVPTGALMGKEISTAQVALCRNLSMRGTKEFVVALDANEDPGPIIEALTGVVPCVTAVMLDQGDPDENRDRMGEYMEGRRLPELSERVRARIARK